MVNCILTNQSNGHDEYAVTWANMQYKKPWKSYSAKSFLLHKELQRMRGIETVQSGCCLCDVISHIFFSFPFPRVSRFSNIRMHSVHNFCKSCSEVNISIPKELRMKCPSGQPGNHCVCLMGFAVKAASWRPCHLGHPYSLNCQSRT